jgi:ABC-2 type transport system ATP-binding protein
MTERGGSVPGWPQLAVQTSALTKRYEGRAVVDAIDLALPRAMITGFVGPNGAGKTTTLRMLLGLVHPTSGTGQVLGQSIDDPSAYLPWVGSLIEAPAFYPALSGRRNLEILATLGGHESSRVDGLLGQAGLGDRADDRFRSYSLGMKQRLGIAAAMLPEPELLVLDEPTNGLDPAGIREVRELLRAMADAGLTILVSSHRLDEIQTICDHLVIIDGGRIRFQGAIGELLERQTTEVVAIPERAGDAPRVAAIARSNGYAVRLDDGRIHVSAPAKWAPRLNAAATASGIILAALWVSHGTLEDAFFAMTADEGPPVDTAPRAFVAPLPARGNGTWSAHRVGGGRIPGVFVSEIMKLRRPGLLLGGGGVLLGFTALVTVLGLERATGASLGQLLRPIVIAELSQPGGLVLGLNRGGTLMGIVVLGIFAAAFGTEYTTGALRNLLVREPRRLEFLSGKYLALIVFGIVVVFASAIVSISTAFAIAPSCGIDTSAWTSAAGVSAVWSAMWHLTLAALGFGTLGAALAVVLRSPVAALAVGVAWILPAESILAAAWADGKYWLPGQLLQNLAVGGSASVSLSRTLVTLGVYWTIVAVGTSLLFVRRDVAS